MCLTGASDYWVDTRSRKEAIQKLNYSFVQMTLNGTAPGGEDLWKYVPVSRVSHLYMGNGLKGSREIEARKDLFQFWKKNLMETGL